MATTGIQRAAKREAETAKAVATLYQHTPRFPETRQVRRAKERADKKLRERADRIAAKRARAKRGAA